MFRGIVQALNARTTRTEAVEVLRTSFDFDLQDAAQIRIMDRVASAYGDVFNPHELAVQFLAELANSINARDPGARGRVEQFIRLVNGAYDRGLAAREHPRDQLLVVARQRFGIDPGALKAS